MIAPSVTYAESSFRCERAQSYNIPVCSKQFITACVESKSLVDPTPFTIFKVKDDVSCNQVGGVSTTTQSNKDVVLVEKRQPVDLAKFRIFKQDEKIPGWIEQREFDVPNYVLLLVSVVFESKII